MKLRRAQRSKHRRSPVRSSTASRRGSSRPRGTPTRIAELHGAIGNQAVGRALTSARSRDRAFNATGAIAPSPHRRPGPVRTHVLQRRTVSLGTATARRNQVASEAQQAKVASTQALKRIKMLRRWLRKLAGSVDDINASVLTEEYVTAQQEIEQAGTALSEPAMTARIQAFAAEKKANATRDSKQLRAAVGDAQAANASAAGLTKQLGELIGKLSAGAAAMARTARAVADMPIAGSIIKIADQAAAEAGAGQPPPKKLDFSGKAKAHGKDFGDSALTKADTANNVVPGLGGGTFSSFEAALPPLKSGAAAHLISPAATSIFGIGAGVLGIVFGLIGFGLGLRAIKRGAHKAKRLKALIPGLTNKHLKDIATYAAEQKRKKKWGGAIGALLGGAAVVAGIVGIIALAVATLGIGAIVLGMGVAALGIGLLVGKWLHKRNKRAKGKEALMKVASDLVGDAMAGDAGAVASLRKDYHMNPDKITLRGRTHAGQFTEELYGKMRADAMSKRAEMAEKTVTHLVQGSPSEQFDAEMIVETLGLKPAKLRQQGKLNPATAKARVMRKLSSW